MVCIYCSGKTSVINSRLQKKLNQTWRRHKCLVCNGLFTSLEHVDLPSSLLFQKDMALTEPFRRDELYISIYEACKHRNDAAGAATALTDTILGKLRLKIEGAELTRSIVISVSSDVLKHFDKAAATSYIAYHPL